MGKSVLIVGHDPALVDFDAPGAPPGMSAEKVMSGLNDAVRRLEGAGHTARLLLTEDAATVQAQVARALEGQRYDVVVIGAGLRTLPPYAELFETLVNTLHELTPPDTRFAFNSRPDDSDAAALRHL